jgi:drug/metabolite transporter (DMT)-like permease
VQVLAVAACAAVWLALTSSPGQLQWHYLEHGVRNNFANLLYLGVVATAVIIAVQTWGQRHTSANEAAIIYAFEPACAAVAAYFWLAETMSLRAVFGGVLLVAGMVVSQWTPRYPEPAAS